ncbi:MAG: hypothetical protein PF638_10615 [Candidatus Delongbacteria bacterium]|jgi:hypothetical protein|nr:hypothetical protein [Candidatus Delongbacteria bacterium]
MKVIIKRIYDSKKKEIGINVFAIIGKKTNQEEKIKIERKLSYYVCDVLYTGKSYNIYSDTNVDSPAIIVLLDINDLPSEEIEI